MGAPGTPYGQRSLPPTNLPKTPDDLSVYHVYRVLKDLNLVAGPIAPWFEQPGLGIQFYTGDNITIKTLLDQGYIKEVNDKDLFNAADSTKCGQ